MSALFTTIAPPSFDADTCALASLALAVVLGGIAAMAARRSFPCCWRPIRSCRGALQILSAGALFVFATWILHAAAISTNLDRRLLVTTGIGLGANVALNIVLIPRYGISGAAWATVMAEGLTVVLLLVQIERRLRRP